MDTFFDSNKQLERLFEQYQKFGTLRIGYDFDDTVSPCRGNDTSMVSQLIRDIAEYAILVCYTARSDDQLTEVYNYLDNHSIPYNYVNKDFDGSEIIGKKIYFNMLLDDKAGLKQSFEILTKFLDQVKKL